METEMMRNTIMYLHGHDFLDKMSEYIDFSSNEELWKEAKQVSGLGELCFRKVWRKAWKREYER